MGAITNLYAYAADNPVNFSDATGTDIDLSNLTYNIPLGQTPIFKFYFNPLLDPFAQQPADLSSQIADAASNPILTPNLNFTPQDPKYQGPKFFPDYPSFTPNSDPSAPLTWSQLHDLVPPQFPNPTLPPLPPIAAPLYPGEPGPASPEQQQWFDNWYQQYWNHSGDSSGDDAQGVDVISGADAGAGDGGGGASD